MFSLKSPMSGFAAATCISGPPTIPGR
ncbi:UNVERIFIED_CONTAM: hypothetical protein GTU68_023734 [Idotea baltica]|nr:hypothetical protein [Idotea baltica]